MRIFDTTCSGRLFIVYGVPFLTSLLLSSSEFMDMDMMPLMVYKSLYTGNMNFVGLAGIMSMEILIYAYRNTLQILW